MSPALARAQAFEVASVRENKTGSATSFTTPALTLSGKVNPRPGPVVFQNAKLREVIAVAYGVPALLVQHLVVGGSERILSTRFDINAKPPEGAPVSDTIPMLRALLADRFKLRASVQKRDTPVYALVLAREGQLGPTLKASSVDCNAPGVRKPATGADSNDVCKVLPYGINKPGPGDMTISDRTPLWSLIMRIQPYLDRPMVDATELSGSFEWSVSFATNPESTTAPIIYTALQEQLGMKADRRTAPFDVVVIDSVEMPTPN